MSKYTPIETDREFIINEAKRFIKSFDDLYSAAFKTTLDNMGLGTSIQDRRMLSKLKSIPIPKLCINNIRKKDIFDLWDALDDDIRDQISNNGEITDKIYHQQVESALLLSLRVLFESISGLQPRAGVLISPTQSGKTGTIIAFNIICSFLFDRSFTKSVKFLSIVPTSISLAEQTKVSTKNAISTLGQIRISIGTSTNKIPLSQCMGNAECIRRTPSSPVIVGCEAKKAEANNDFLVVNIDESHWGSGKKSPLDKIFHELNECMPSKNYCVILVSATTYELMNAIHENTAWMVKQRLDYSYQGIVNKDGYAFSSGEVFEDKIKPLPIHSISDYVTYNKAIDSSLSEILYLDSNKNYYCKENKFKKIKGISNQLDYRKKINRELAVITNHLLINHNTNKGEGMVMRWAKSQQNAKDLAIEMRDSGLDDNIVVLILNHEITKEIEVTPIDVGRKIYHGTTKTRVEKVINKLRDNINSGDKILIMVLGTGRMGHFFPASFTYFYDATNETGNNDTIIQGLAGRGTGYGKNSMILLSEENKKIMDKIVESNGLLGANPSARSNLTNKPPKDTLMVNVDFSWLISQKLSNGLETVLLNFFIEVEHRSGTLSTYANKANKPKFNSRIGLMHDLVPYIDELEKNIRMKEDYHNVCLLRLGETTMIKGKISRFDEDNNTVMGSWRVIDTNKKFGRKGYNKNRKDNQILPITVCTRAVDVNNNYIHGTIKEIEAHGIDHRELYTISFPINQEHTKLKENSGVKKLTTTGNEKSCSTPHITTIGT